ncbi:Uncharacterised protein [Cedecea lapagei]|uniref:Uncharacterized protein n=1 Tax=Cedecea lapagei TaxID=158823 RepID=A0A3S4IG14_9ENTR|nr:hypothetical protein [Cedecea lapagei]VEC00014.1 Uncharacterised protein [Cedecea lapagei]
MTEPRIERLYGKGAAFKFKFKRAHVAIDIAEYYGDDIVDSAHYIRAGKVLKEGVERGVIKKVGAARYQLVED